MSKLRQTILVIEETKNNENVFNENQMNKFLEKVKIKQIACGFFHTTLLDDQNNVYSCGINADGQLGLGHYENVNCFKKIDGFKAKFITASSNLTIIVTLENEIYGAGKTFMFESNHFKIIEKLENFTIKNIKSGGFTITIILNNQNELFGIGYNNSHQLGFENLFLKFTKFEKLNLPPAVKEIKDFGCSDDYTSILTKNNDVYVTGFFQFRTFTKLDFQAKQIGCLPGYVYFLSLDNEIYNHKGFEFRIKHNLNIEHLYSGAGLIFCVLTNENKLYKHQNFHKGRFTKVEGDWKLNHLFVFSGENFAIILNSNYKYNNYDLGEEESHEMKRMKRLLFGQLESGDVILY